MHWAFVRAFVCACVCVGECVHDSQFFCGLLKYMVVHMYITIGSHHRHHIDSRCCQYVTSLPKRFWILTFFHFMYIGMDGKSLYIQIYTYIQTLQQNGKIKIKMIRILKRFNFYLQSGIYSVVISFNPIEKMPMWFV